MEYLNRISSSKFLKLGLKDFLAFWVELPRECEPPIMNPDGRFLTARDREMIISLADVPEAALVGDGTTGEPAQGGQTSRQITGVDVGTTGQTRMLRLLLRKGWWSVLGLGSILQG